MSNFPKWLHQKLPKKSICNTFEELHNDELNTVCIEAKCPNRLECFSKKTATFLALGNQCTRNCSFCDIDFAKTPKLPDDKEPHKIALLAKKLNLKHIVITMVCRDDLEDQGANHISKILQTVNQINPDSTIEVLVSDFSLRYDLIDIVLDQKPHIFNHNIETVKELSSKIRHIANYDSSLKVLKYAHDNSQFYIKSGIMVGLGEKEDQVKETIKDLYLAGCDIITIGQYLQPSKHKYPIKAFIHPDQFKEYEQYAKSIGIKYISSGPFVRSSYNAEHLKNLITHN